jgi:hypothetical protein
MMACNKCGRSLVADGHQCDGDPRSTCGLWGCGRTKSVELYDGMRWRVYCSVHAFLADEDAA